ncbi:MAG: hypothetical protein ACLVL7_05620 [Anaerotruncus massiliensis (ex Togo et al. 2019)]
MKPKRTHVIARTLLLSRRSSPRPSRCCYERPAHRRDHPKSYPGGSCPLLPSCAR